jgi:hypothetical protein
MYSTRRLAVISWVLGFFLVANIYLLPGNPHSPRALDLLSLVLWGWLLWRLMTRGVQAGPLVTLVVIGLVPLCWGLYARLQGLQATMFLSIRWTLALPWGYALLLLIENRHWRNSFLRGLWWGLALNAAVLLWQSTPWGQLTYQCGLASPDSELISLNRFVWRNPGLHGHPNASAAVASLIVPLSLFLYYRREAGLWLPLTSLVCMLAVGHVTSSRSPLLIAAIGFLIVTLTARRFLRALTVLALGAILVIPIWLQFGPPGGRVRWADTAHMSANTSERLASNLTAARLATEHFWGQGIEASQRTMRESLQLPETHNAFLQVGIIYGPGQAILLLLLLGLLAWHSRHGIHRIWGLEALLALQLCGLFLCEEHLNNPTFITFTVWLAVTSVARLGGLTAPISAPVSGTETAPPTPVPK